MLRLSKRGIPLVNGNGRGDHLVHLKFKVPSELTARQRELMMEFAALEADRSGTVRDLNEHTRDASSSSSEEDERSDASSDGNPSADSSSADNNSSAKKSEGSGSCSSSLFGKVKENLFGKSEKKKNRSSDKDHDEEPKAGTG